MWVKICGITRLEDAECAAQIGADAVGFVFAESPRKVTTDTAREICYRMPDGPVRVGVFVDSPLEEVRETVSYCGLDMVQLHGKEGPGFCEALGDAAIKALKVRNNMDVFEATRYGCPMVLLDARNGNGAAGREEFDWTALRLLEGGRRLVVAGGLGPDNVARVVKAARPYGVDVARGVESSPGVKDPVLMYSFIEKARRAEYEVRGC